MVKRLIRILTFAFIFAALSVSCYAADYHFDAPDAGLFGRPTSDDTVYVDAGEALNTDRSKNAALIPPAFGSPTSNLPNSGELLTPNLVQGGQASGTTISASTTTPPSVNMGTATSSIATIFRSVSSDLYYSGGYVAKLSISSIGLNVNVYEGTDSAALLHGAGHFPETSIWGGNICVAGHNRGVNNHFGRIHTLAIGDTISYTTKLGTATYEVFSVRKILATEVSVLNADSRDMITLITCVNDQPAYRWCVQAIKRF
jgi:LPXTG-site transpeptidase (sortase) family protein